MKNRWNYLIVTLPFALMIVIGSAFDLPINESLYNDPSSNVFGLVFSGIMPVLSYAFFNFIEGYILRAGIVEKNKFVKVICFVIAIAGFAGSAYFTVDKAPSINAWNNPDLWAISIPLGIIINLSIFYFGFRTAKKNYNRNFVISAITMAAFMLIAIMPVAQILKDVMRRPRYRVLVAGNVPDARYVAWWVSFKPIYDTLVNPISENFKSFPSGHTGEAAMLILGLPLIGQIIPKLKNKETILTIVATIFTLSMALSRMTMGAHYMSDCGFGGLIMVVCSIIANEINLKFFKIENKEETNN